MFFVGGRKKIKDIKMPVTKRKRPITNSAVSSDEELRIESTPKTPKVVKKQKVIQEKETRKPQKVIIITSFHIVVI